MLTDLIVQDVALARHLELEFDRGMTAITGETGAGKSILLDALGLALGDRAESGLIADTAERAEVNATFDVSDNPRAIAWLTERELDADDACILRRTISRDGRSRGFINGAPSTVADMKALGDMLIDIHSQHEHHSLLRRETHRRLLDEFGDLAELAADVSRVVHSCTETKHALDHLVASSQEQSARLQLLSYQSEELAALAATENEPSELAAEQKRLANAEAILRACSDAIALCSEAEEVNLQDQLSRAIALVASIDLPETHAIVEMLEGAQIQIQEASHDISRFSNSVELDPDRLTIVESRLSDLYDAARKHHIRPEEIPSLEARINEELARLGNADGEIDKLRARLDKLTAEYHAAANKLSKARHKAAKTLTGRVSTELERLGMKGSVFDISLIERGDAAPHPNGLEDIEFLISTNPGQAPRALNRIASGGELSRISLAIQVVTADTSKVPTLIFDEVDVGIGGAVAEVVGSLLRQLGTKAQIVCVTHLPQVAAQAHQHYRVIKHSDKTGARTDIATLSGTEKVEEIARMLGGVKITAQSLAHAEEMFAGAQVRDA